MGKIADIIKKFLLGFLNKALEKARSFFDKPKALIALQVAALAILNPLLTWLKALLEKKISQLLNKGDDLSFIADINNITDDDVENYVKNNRDLQRLMNFAGNSLDESSLSDITLACTDPDYYTSQAAKMKSALKSAGGGLDGNDYIRIATTESDFDEKVNGIDLTGIANLLDKLSGILPWVFMVYIIILKVKEFLTQNEFPSKYRGKYAQRLLRIVAKILKEEKAKAEDTKASTEEIDGMLKGLKAMDAIIGASLMATFIYLENRKKLQGESLIALNSLSAITCNVEIEPAGDFILDTSSLRNLNINDINNVTCPVDIAPVVPHEPFELKATNERLNSCDVETSEPKQASLDADAYYDIANKALIENTTKDPFNIKVSKNQLVNTQTVLGAMGDSLIYSPVDGVVLSTSKNKVILGDISDPESTYVDELIKETQDLYTELNNIKFFIKDFYVNSWFPVLLAASPLIDASLNAEELGKIQYPNGGVSKRFKLAQKDADKRKEDYEKRVEQITGKDNVKTKCENDEILLIKEEVDEEEKTYYEGLQVVTTTAENQSKVTLPKPDEFLTLDYFYDIYAAVLSLWEQNDVTRPFRDELNSIIIERFFIDGWDVKKLERKVNSLCKDLAEGTFFEETRNFFRQMLLKYDTEHDLKAVEDYVASLSKNNEEFTTDQKDAAIAKIMFVFNFVLEIKERVENEYAPELNRYDATASEANFIDNYFASLWKRYGEIPKRLEEVLAILEDVGITFTTYTVIDIDDEEYRYYSLSERTCPVPDATDGDDYLSPFSEAEYKDFKYWLKYCAIATLVGITNFPLGWGTGFPPPIGPIPFPVIYIPIKAFQLNWGIIVIGISITGIYPFPWVLISNLSTEYHVPFVDPAGFIRKQIDAVKKELTGSLKNYRQSTLKSFMEKQKKEVEALTVKVDVLTETTRLHKLEKPKRDRTQKNSLVTYTSQLAGWTSTQATFKKDTETLKVERYKAEIKYDIAYKAFSGTPINDTPDPKIEAMKKTEELIDKQFQKLDVLIASIGNLLAPLPITTKPETANFAFTIKNPKPINKFADDLNDNINTGVLNPIIENFELKSEDLMTANYSSQLNKSVLNWDKYTGALRASMPLIVQKDPFPKYENLKLTNITWISFLYKDWTTKGAQTYGFPGFPQVPVG